MAEATDNCINFVKMKFVNNTLYFQAENDDDLETDYFGRLESRISVIRNLDNQVLFFNNQSQAVFEDMPDSDRKENEEQTKFILYLYKDSDGRGVATAISVNCGQTHTLSCKNKVASFKEMIPPQRIDETGSDIIFFQKTVPGHPDKRRFESSLYKGYYLACQKENDLFKLVLKQKEETSVNKLVDKSVMFTVQVEE